MSAETQKSNNIPPPVQNAKTALEALRRENAATAKEIEKILTGYALQLERAGEDYSAKTLLAAARQGRVFLREQSDTALKLALRPLTYETIYAELNKDLYAGKTLQEQLNTAVAFGDLDHLRHCQAQGADIHADGDAVLTYAAFEGHIHIMEYLLENGADKNANSGTPLYYAILARRRDVVEFLTDKGANTVGIALMAAAMAGDLDLIKSYRQNDHPIDYKRPPLSERRRRRQAANQIELAVDDIMDMADAMIAEIRAVKDDNGRDYIGAALIRESAERGHIHILEYLLQEQKIAPEDIEYRQGRIIYHAVRRGQCAVIDRFLKNADASTFEGNLKEDLETFGRQRKLWRETLAMDPPPGLHDKNPRYFDKEAFETIKGFVRRENATHLISNETIYHFSLLFNTGKKALRYLKKWGLPAEREPFSGMLEKYFKPFRIDPGGDANLKNWGDAVLQHGPAMLKLAQKLAHAMPAPLKSADGKNWSATKTREEAVKFFYKRCAENKQMADICFKFNIKEEHFNAALDIVKTTPSHKKKLPKITLDGRKFGMENAKFYRLAENDIRGLFLGEYVNCCQYIGSAGDRCARHGYTSQDGGFYVLEVKGKICGLTWAWRGKRGEMCFDSLEGLRGETTPDDWESLMRAVGRELQSQKRCGISRLHVGTGGTTPPELGMAFKESARKAKPRKGVKAYDAQKKQLLIWKRGG